MHSYSTKKMVAQIKNSSEGKNQQKETFPNHTDISWWISHGGSGETLLLKRSQRQIGGLGIKEEYDHGVDLLERDLKVVFQHLREATRKLGWGLLQGLGVIR